MIYNALQYNPGGDHKLRSCELNISSESDYYVYSPSVMARETLLYPVCTGHFFYEPGYSLNRDSYDSYLILYVESGSMSVSPGGCEYVAEQGSFVFLNCYLPHSYRTNTGCECYWCHFDGAAADAFFRYATEKSGTVLSLIDPDYPASKLKAIYHCFSGRNAVREPIIARYLNDILTSFLPGSESDSTISEHQKMVESAISYIGEHLNEDITVDMLARMVGLSPCYFIRTFKTATGFPPHGYLRNARLNAAKYLLANTCLPLKEICLSVGFSCESVFCSAFKKSVGVTPTEYRNGIPPASSG